MLMLCTISVVNIMAKQVVLPGATWWAKAFVEFGFIAVHVVDHLNRLIMIR